MKYDGCEVVRVARYLAGSTSVYDRVVAGDGTILQDKYVGTLPDVMFEDESLAELQRTRETMRLVGQLSVEPLTEAKVDEREPQAAG